MHTSSWTGIVRLAICAAGLGLGISTWSCKSEGYCLDCFEDAKSGTGDGGGDARTNDGSGPNDGGLADGGGGDFDACIPSGEVCDGLDNDCDGEVDNGALPGVGVDCGTDEGPCAVGKNECIDGKLVCGEGAINPVNELCDNVDNDCDGNIDENNPGGGLVCGSATGDCQTGVTECDLGTHTIICKNEVVPVAETCDGHDNDCDNSVDEGTGGEDCGPVSDVGLCKFGTMTCVGGQLQCKDAVYPQVELCDTMDQDCDGQNTDGFNLLSDPNNCGGCNIKCEVFQAYEKCDMQVCKIASCVNQYWNNNGTYSDGCEYGPCEFQGAEDCNGVDDDCDGLVDLDDPDLQAPNICDPDGECAGTVATCEGGSGWQCNYPSTVEVDGDGNIIPETRCDYQDNDCDGLEDEAFPLRFTSCDDGEMGVCTDSGTYQCNSAENGVECDAMDDDSPTAEKCNGLDDDCDGQTDEGDLNTWVDVGDFEIFAYEASRPDASKTSQGTLANRPCSKVNAKPWTNITHDEAEAKCAAVGATLCSEAQWQQACETNYQDPGLLIVEAESFSGQNQPCTDSWTADTAITGFSGASYMAVGPNNGSSYGSLTCSGMNCSSCSNGSAAVANVAARMDYTLNFATAGTWYVWVRGYGSSGSDDSVHAGLDNATQSNTDRIGSFPAAWSWVSTSMDGDRVALSVPTTGSHTFNIYMREDGFLIDRFILTQDINFVPYAVNDPTAACEWSYSDDCKEYQPTTCNGNDYDPSAVAGDQDRMTYSGQMTACYADWGGTKKVFDMSGNVKEWTTQRANAINPIRGGSYNNTATGISCQFNFLTADDTFLFENIGFRCCR